MRKDLERLTRYQIKERERSTRSSNDPSKPSREYKRLIAEQNAMIDDERRERTK